MATTIEIIEKLKSKTWFKILDKEGNSIHGGSLKWSLPNGIPGEWHEVVGKVKCCSNGLHFTCKPVEWVKKDCRFFVAEIDLSEFDFENDTDDEKICVRKGRLVREASPQELFENGIYLQGTHVLKNGLYHVGGSATVKAWGSATVEACDSATVKASGSATVKAWGSATVKAWGSATVKAWGNATVKAWGNATVEASGSATVKAWGSATVKAWGSATVKAWGNAYLIFHNDETKHSISDMAIKKDYYNKKIYVKKGSHTIIEVD